MEISCDGGKSWAEASLGKEIPSATVRRLWHYDWGGGAGKCRQGRLLITRATDSRGRNQPMERDQNRGGYMINHCIPLEVKIR